MHQFIRAEANIIKDYSTTKTSVLANVVGGFLFHAFQPSTRTLVYPAATAKLCAVRRLGILFRSPPRRRAWVNGSLTQENNSLRRLSSATMRL